MMHRIASLFLPLLRLLLPGGGRHRAVAPTPAAAYGGAGPAAVAPLRGRTRPPLVPLRGEDVHLVRPYILSEAEFQERRERRERRLRRSPRRALWLAAHGVDVGPRDLRGMAVAA
ncbi:hypothetical protein MOV08_26095 [Streptomyces yunnanensis]|uniref:Uncharacterized protein n=1 Tax=Streptomyces yunnanensis TaxID=156453 RepID=A0ABY8AFI2_9ACTN|nr:hypothetical protein [Streptomyces yunnanensis]WEB42377.1 hypothetical protein MOV08_26095 [Streptomyces yunnanensis]